jgi:lipopolysaccharide export LptBFGC system permease protein LptF
MKGFIYVLSNPSLPSLKIGKTKADPSQRVKELTGSTSIPTPFNIEYYAYVDEFDEKEREIHKLLDEVRVNKNREFFEIDIASAIGTIEATCNVLYSEKLASGAISASDEEIKEVSEATAKLIEMEEKIQAVEELNERLSKARRKKAKANSSTDQWSGYIRVKEKTPFRVYIYNALTWPVVVLWLAFVAVMAFDSETGWGTVIAASLILAVPAGLWITVVGKILGVED